MRRKFTLGLIFTAVAVALYAAGCGLKMPAIIQHNLWDQARPLSTPPDYHLLLVWKEGEKSPDPPLAHPETLVHLLAKEYEEKGAGHMLSWQIVDDLSAIEPLLSVWRPEIPVLFLDARFKLNCTTQTLSASLSGIIRFQPFLYDTTLEKTNGESKIERSTPTRPLRQRCKSFCQFDVVQHCYSKKR